MSATIPAGEFKKLKLPGAKGILYLGGDPRGVTLPKDVKMAVYLGTDEGLVPWRSTSHLGFKVDLVFRKKEYADFIKYVADLLKSGGSVCIGYEKATRSAAVLTGLLRVLDPTMTSEAVAAWVLDQFHPEPFANSHWPADILALLGVQFPGGKVKKQNKAKIKDDFDDEEVAEPDEDD